MGWAGAFVAFSLLVGLMIALWQTGCFRWLAMAAAFLVQEGRPERRTLIVLRLKLWALRTVAGWIGRTEARIAEVGRSEDG